MKKIIIVSILTFFLILILYILYSFLGGNLLIANSNYIITGDKGKTIPCKVFVKNIKVNSIWTKELLIIFDQSIGLKKPFDVLLIVPRHTSIGIPERGINGFFNIGNNCIYQKNKNSDKFTSILNNTTFFDDPPIKSANFHDKRIKFTSYDTLKQFGESVIITWK